MTDDLVKRLRAVSLDIGYPSTTTLPSEVTRQAADRIEELEAELRKSALKELAALSQACERYSDQLAAEVKLLEKADELARLQGENERLSAALRSAWKSQEPQERSSTDGD